MINLKRVQTFVVLFCAGIFLYSCDTMGQIGNTFSFHTSADTVERGLDTLFAKHPEYKVPQGWVQYENLKPRPTAFTENKYFYFKADTAGSAEMYYVVLINGLKMTGDSSRTNFAIRAVNTGSDKWILEQQLGYKDERRIAKRFSREIVAKLKEYTGAKVRKEE